MGKQTWGMFQSRTLYAGSGDGDTAVTLWAVPGGEAIAAGALQSPAAALAWAPAHDGPPQLLTCSEVKLSGHTLWGSTQRKK